MALLHGSWLPQPLQPTEPHPSFFLWGEVWRRATPEMGEIWTVEASSSPAAQPFAMGRSELVEFLSVRSSRLAGLTAESQRWRYQTIALPSYVSDGVVLPQHSAAELQPDVFLFPWQIEGLCLSPMAAIEFLSALPLRVVNADESFVGGDLQFWAHVARWSLDLLTRCKFLPVLKRSTEEHFLAQWEPLLDSEVDRLRLAKFSDRLPPTCRTYQATSAARAIELPEEPQAILYNGLSQMLDAQVRAVAQAQAPSQTPPHGTGRSPGKSPSAIAAPVREWLQALGHTPEVAAAPPLLTALNIWTAPLQQRGLEQSQFRTCLVLHPPLPGRLLPGQSDWKLEYFLQAAHDPEFLVSAPTIWNNPVERLSYRGESIVRPQETLLRGLGLASRLYGLMEPSLQDARPQFCTLTPLQAYEFLKSVAW
ncbi:MAG TPA: hypothetical protein V6D18_03945, partial [Thermosynechococcaceae cyanobacterium]